MLHIALNGIPISSNKAYFDRPGGGRVLTAHGKRYKSETTATLVRDYPTDLKFFESNKGYGILIVLFMPTVLNKGWPETAKTRYKKLDASNRVKLLEDALIDATGIDDSQFLLPMIAKLQHPEEATVIRCWDIELEGAVPKSVNDYLSSLFSAQPD